MFVMHDKGDRTTPGTLHRNEAYSLYHEESSLVGWGAV
jgi:hypothetical protein